ncbi:hypothetical protein OJ996_26315 [Luteolibacter sp. GHJ8]|uniref:Uncharacterized protein n=1 Tax=Luteolibacter rhizosphaerae TaxID=2989719 RepID=A0ABT3GBX3_9BACT|nr:hypothetical protein [Luteolibacter rhizosphaerae]MCW1917124.1 hypothetical protein [Luteolibacter rhizosphaerae]
MDLAELFDASPGTRSEDLDVSSPGIQWQAKQDSDSFMRDAGDPFAIDSGAEYRSFGIQLPHWLLSLIYLPLWGGLALVLRAWKRRRMRIA